MPLQDQIFPVDFSGGMNTKTDPKKVSGEFLLVQDGVYTQVDDVEKRNGYTMLTTAIAGGGNLVAPRMMSTYNNEITCQDSGQLYSLSTTLQAWEKQGNYTSIDFSDKGIFNQSSTGSGNDVATAGNLTFYVYEYVIPSIGTGPSVVITVQDNDTGATVLAPTTLSVTVGGTNGADTAAPRCVKLSNSTVAVFYLSTTTSLAMRILTISGTVVSVGAETIVENNIRRIGSSHSHPIYDVASSATGCVLMAHLYGSPDSIRTRTISSSGTTTATSSLTLTSTQTDNPVACTVDPTNGNIWVYFVDSPSGGQYQPYYAVYTSTLGVVLGASSMDFSTAVPLIQITAQVNTPTNQTAFFTAFRTDSLFSSQGINCIESYTVTSVGAVTPNGIVATGIGIASRVFTYSGTNYFLAYYQGPSYDPSASSSTFPSFEPTFFVFDTSNNCVVGRFASAVALSLPYWYAPQVTSLSASQFVFLGAKKYASAVVQSQSGTPGAIQQTVSTYGSFSVQFSFNTPRVYKNTPAGQLNLLNGAMISAYDGQTCAEWGFHLYPEILSITQATGGGGVIPAGTYAYVAVYQWIDANGNLHQSSPSQETIVTVISSSSEVTLEITNPYESGKSGITIQVYRTVASGTQFFQVTGTTSTSSLFTRFIDNNTDASVLTGFPLYTNGGVPEYSTPPPSMIIEERYNRAWFVDAENANTTLWYSKYFTPGFGLAPTAFNTTQIDPTKGNIAGLKAMDDKMVVFKDFGVLWFAGDGANDAGTGSSLTQPQTVPSATGLMSLSSLTLVPNGIIYQTTKGIFLLDRGMGVHYADQTFNGAAIEAYSKNIIYDSRIIPNTTQIRFLCATGSSLHYDYMYNKWSVFTNHLGYSSDIWENTYTYVRTDAAMYQENATSYLDNTSSYPLTVTTSWLAIAGIQGFERLRHLLALGDQSGTATGHGIQISTAVNFIPSYTAHNPFFFTTNPGTSTPFQFRQFLTIQKCDSMSLIIQEIVTGAAGEYCDFTNLSFNCGIKKGLHKVRSAVSVG